MDYGTPNEESNQLNEPDATHSKKPSMRLRIFKSFEEANEADAFDSAMQPPVERLRETVELILRVYGVTREQLKARNKKRHINIISRG